MRNCVRQLRTPLRSFKLKEIRQQRTSLGSLMLQWNYTTENIPGFPCPTIKWKATCSSAGTSEQLASSVTQAKSCLKIILNRLKPQAEKIIAEEQAGFRVAPQSRSLNLRILCEKYLQRQHDLYCVFTDFKKAFDRVWHAALWAAMKKYNINTNLIQVIKNLYSKATSAVLVNSSVWDWFRTTAGARQGCLSSPTLWWRYLAWDTLQESTDNSSIDKAETIWNDKSISLSCKIRLMRSLVTYIFLCACESWTLTAELQRRMQAMEMRCYCKDTTHPIQKTCYQRGSPCKDPAGNRTTRRLPDNRKETQTAVVWTCLPFCIRSGQNHLARNSEGVKKTRQTEEEVGR